MTKKANEINVKNIMQEYQNTLANLSQTLDVMARMIGTISESETEHPAEESKMLAGSIPAISWSLRRTLSVVQTAPRSI